MKKREIPVMNLGISLIILIFMNVCLAAFAVLSLQNALSDYALTKKTAAHTTQYYKAVNKVQEQLAQKNTELEKQWAQKKTAKQKEIGQKGTAQKTVKQKTVILSEINIIESVSKRQQLVVTLHLDKTGTVPQYCIKKWQLCSPEDWQADESLDVMKSIE